MFSVSLRALLVLRRIDGEWDGWLIKRYPTVELRATKLGCSRLPTSDDMLFGHFRTLIPSEEKEQYQLFGISSPNCKKEAVAELISQLHAILLVSLRRGNDDGGAESKKQFLVALSRAIPFGSPLQTHPSVICGDFFFQSEGKCTTPNLMDRALPNWFPGPRILDDTRLKRLTSSLLRSQDVKIWIEEVLNVILYRNEDEFKFEEVTNNFCAAWSIFSTLFCQSRCKNATEAIVSLVSSSNDKNFLFGMDECVQRVERDENDVKITFIPPPRLFDDLEEPIPLCRWRVDEYSPPLLASSIFKESSGASRGFSSMQPFRLKSPIEASYRLRQQAEDLNSYQVILKIIGDGVGVINKLVARMRMPTEFSISELKLNHSIGKVEHDEKFVVWTITSEKLTATNNSHQFLLSGTVVCNKQQPKSIDEKEERSHLIYSGETSCCFLEFEILKLPVTDVSIENVFIRNGLTTEIEQRLIKSGKFMIWNPFGDFPKGALGVVEPYE